MPDAKCHCFFLVLKRVANRIRATLFEVALIGFHGFVRSCDTVNNISVVYRGKHTILSFSGHGIPPGAGGELSSSHADFGNKIELFF